VFRGLPSLGVDLSSLYVITCPETGKQIRARDPYDVAQHPIYQLVLSLVESYITSLESSSHFPSSNGAANDNSKVEPPATLLWALFWKFSLLESAGRLLEALETIEACIKHTPTAIDMLQRKARLMKKMGEFNTAADIINDARQLDLADRYINNKTTKYLLRADRVEEAQNVIAIFAKHEGDPQHNLFEMQCMW